jgi:exonuclease III
MAVLRPSHISGLLSGYLAFSKVPMKFLYWNIAKKPLVAQISELARSEDVDVVILLECVMSAATIQQHLHHRTGVPFHYSPLSSINGGHLYTRFARALIAPLPRATTPRTAFRVLRTVKAGEVLLVITHAPSRWTSDFDDHGLFCDKLSRKIRRIENRQLHHDRSFVVGDLNANPFDPGIAAARGLHGVMTRQIATRRPRQIHKSRYKFFYNPMWSVFGDDTPGPPGTYYHHSSKAHHLFWHTFDQLLVRPQLLPFLSKRSVRVLDTIGSQALVVSDRMPKGPMRSDHLPIAFELTF